MSDSFMIPWTVAHQAPLSVRLPRQEYWSGLLFPSPGDLSDPGIKPISPALAGGFFTSSSTWEAHPCIPSRPSPLQTHTVLSRDFPGGSDSKESACNAGDPGLIPGSERSPGGGHGSPLQYSCLENPTEKEAWWAAVQSLGSQKSWT